MLSSDHTHTNGIIPASMLNLQQEILRRLLLLLGMSALLGFVLLAPPWPGEHGWLAFGATLAWSAACVAAYWLVPHHIRQAQLLMLIALAWAITSVAWETEQPLIVFLYAFVPLLAGMLIGWHAGLVAAALVAGMVALLGQAGIVPYPLGAALVAITFVVMAIGTTVNQVLTTALDLALAGLERAQALIEEARNQRLELKQIEEDLLQSNREQVRLLERLKAMNLVAEEARQTKQEFIARVSHELRTPLNMIIAYSELITRSPQLYGRRLPPSLLADMSVILRNSQHLSKLVDDVLDLSQIDAGRMALSKEWTQIEEVIADATETVQPLFGAKKLFLDVELDPSLPLIFCDRTRIRQVVINLLSNAGRFTDEGGVIVRAQLQDEQLHLSIADTGPGIKPEDCVHLFEPFQQIDATLRRKHGGSGLGLSISKHFVEMHDGRIWLESEVGVGTTFYIDLPLVLKRMDILDPLSARRWVNPFNDYYPRTRPRLAPVPYVAPRYVVLEREPIIARLLGRYLRDAEIIRVPTLSQAIQILTDSPAQALMINSALLPELPWPEGVLRSVPFDTPVIVCWFPDNDSAQQLGVQQYLIKPINLDMLLQAIRGIGPDVRTLLLADDEPDMLRIFTRALTGAPEGYRVAAATDGAEALTLLRELKPDALVLDLMMPEMSGFDLLKAKAQDPAIRDIPVVIVSSRDPNRQPIMSNQLFVARGSGFSSRDMLDCIQALTEVLAPVRARESQASTEIPAG